MSADDSTTLSVDELLTTENERLQYELSTLRELHEAQQQQLAYQDQLLNQHKVVAEMPEHLVMHQLSEMLDTMALLLEPLDELEALVTYEQQRKLEPENPMLHALRKSLQQVNGVLVSHGISELAPSGSSRYAVKEHELITGRQASHTTLADGDEVVLETVRVGYRHEPTGCVLRRAKVLARPAAAGGGGGAPAEAGVEQVHEVQSSDTLQAPPTASSPEDGLSA